MSIKKIEIENFKSFQKSEVQLKNFNVLIGANASGKSNFISIFRFLGDIVNHGLDNAISMQGGIEYFRNVNIGHSRNFSAAIHLDVENLAAQGAKNGNWPKETRTKEVIYRFTLEFHKHKKGFAIADDRLFLKYDLLARNGKKNRIKKNQGEGTLTLVNSKGKLKPYIEIPGDAKLEKQDIFPFIHLISELSPRGLLLETPLLHFPLDLPGIFKSISVYNIDPAQSKKAIPLSGKTELEEDGNNLALVLKNLLDNKANKRKLANLLKDVLTFVDDLEVEKFGDRSLLVRLREEYSKNRFLPASLLSDGTINITALLVALYFGKKPFIIFEEPERSIHPYLLSGILEMMKEVSARRQIIVTTHNPEILRHIRPGDILFIARDKEGFSRISTPSENEQVKIFLKNEMGMDELFVQNLLEL